MANPSDVWERAKSGRHAVLLGQPISDPPQDLRVVRVSCDVPPSTLGPLLEARDQIERVLGSSAPLVEMARTRVMTGLRRHLLGDLLTVSSDGSLVDVYNRFAALAPAVLVLEAADAADPSSLDMLRHILGRTGWLRLPVLLVMRAGPLPPAAAALVDEVRRACGDEAIFSADPAPSAEASPASAAPATEPAPAIDLKALPPHALRVLRALAIAGSGCEAHILAAALEMSELGVLDALQGAADAGVPLEDRGEGRVHLSASVVESLRTAMLPSLAAELHRRVAAAVARDRTPEPPSVRPVALPPPHEAARPGNAWEVMQAEPPPTMRLPVSEPAPPEVAAEPDAGLEAALEEPTAEEAEAERAAERAAVEEAAAETAAEERAAHLAVEEAARRAAEEAVEHAAFEARRASMPAATGEVEIDSARAAERAQYEAEAEAELVQREAEQARREAEAEAARAAEQARREAEAEAARAAEEAAAHAAQEARRDAEAAAQRAEDERRAAEEAAAAAVAQAHRELSDERSPAPAYFKPFTGEPRPASAAGASRWSAPRPADPPPPERRADDARFAPPPHRDERGRRRPDARPADDARAARHLAAAGDAEAAIERYVEAMRKAASAAAYPQAVAHAQSALALLERLPPTDERRQRRARLLLQAARVLWHGAGPDASFKLPGALRVIESARALVEARDPVELIAEIAITSAGILYEIGDVASLTRALDELSTASRALADAGRAQDAARLFNDQASVLIRLGDPVRAAHLLTESRKIFEEASKTEPVAAVEMAETDHHFARILLHVPARPGREGDALSMALDHAIAAERAFRRLGAPREVGRVLETMGRIELRKGRLSRAADKLTEALQIQEQIGDVVGLARSTAALSEVLAAGGRVHEALNLLGDSIVLNFEKGSPLGVAFNRRALQALAEDEGVRRSAPELLGEAAARLSAAEKAVGRVPIPGTANPA